jgi:hypothetical protein
MTATIPFPPLDLPALLDRRDPGALCTLVVALARENAILRAELSRLAGEPQATGEMVAGERVDKND